MKAANILTVSGVLALVAGLLALVYPFPATFAVTVLVGWGLVIASALGLYVAFSDTMMPARGWAIFFNLLELVVGVWILANPLAGMVSLTIVVGALMLASGAVRIVVSLGHRRSASLFWMMLLSGLISAGLGLYILLSLPTASLVLPGLLVAIELLMIGAMLLALGLSIRSAMRS